MAAGDLYIWSNNRFFVRAASDGTWSQANVGTRSSVRGMAIGRDGTIHVTRGTVSNPRISSRVNNAWVNTPLPGSSRPGVPTGLGINAEGVFFCGRSGDIYTLTTGNPILSPGLPNDAFGLRITLQGLSVRQSDGTIAVCGQRNVYELASGGSAWVESTIPSTVIDSIARSFSSCTYDHLGRLWVYDILSQRYHHRASDGTWASDAQIPTTIGGQSISRTGIQGTAFDQGRGVVQNLKLGVADMDAAFIGSQEVVRIHLGDTLVWGVPDVERAPVWSESTYTFDGFVGEYKEFDFRTLLSSNPRVSTIAITGSLPGGFAFNPQTGIMGGTPTETTGTPVTLTATNSEGSDALTVNFDVRRRERPLWALLPNRTYTSGENVSLDLNPYVPVFPVPTITVSGLPTGLTETNGVISGQPTEVGTHTITVTATSSLGSDTETFTITVQS